MDEPKDAPSEPSLDNRPTDPCPPPDEEERMPREWMIWYNRTHHDDD